VNRTSSGRFAHDVNGYYGTASLASAGYFFWARDSTHVYGAGHTLKAALAGEAS